jgi:hypothetical protein
MAAGARHHRLGLKGRSIFNRKKPLAPKTLARIYAGAVKFKWPEPFLVILRNHMAGRASTDRCRRSRRTGRISGWRSRSSST